MDEILKMSLDELIDFALIQTNNDIFWLVCGVITAELEKREIPSAGLWATAYTADETEGIFEAVKILSELKLKRRTPNETNDAKDVS